MVVGVLQAEGREGVRCMLLCSRIARRQQLYERRDAVCMLEGDLILLVSVGEHPRRASCLGLKAAVQRSSHTSQ